MRIFTFLASIAVMATACNQTSSLKNKHTAVTDLQSENLKGQVQQLETDIYLIDSATGKMGKLDSKSTETYDSSGYTVSEKEYEANDSSVTLYIFGHNANGFQTLMKGTKNGKPFSSSKFDVDSAGNYSLATFFDSTGKEDAYLDSISTNKYGQFVSAKVHNSDSTLKMTYTNFFDSLYATGSESKDSLGKLTDSFTLKLNDKKDPLQMDETTVTKDSTTKTTHNYTYDIWDKHGNWLQQTVIEKGKPKKIVKRIITYKS